MPAALLLSDDKKDKKYYGCRALDKKKTISTINTMPCGV